MKAQGPRSLPGSPVPAEGSAPNGDLGRDPTPPGISRGPVSPDFSPDLLSRLKCVAIKHLYRYFNFLKTSPCAPRRGGDDKRDGPGTCVPAGPVPAPLRPATTLSTCSWGLVPPPPPPRQGGGPQAGPPPTSGPRCLAWCPSHPPEGTVQSKPAHPCEGRGGDWSPQPWSETPRPPPLDGPMSQGPPSGWMAVPE